MSNDVAGVLLSNVLDKFQCLIFVLSKFNEKLINMDASKNGGHSASLKKVFIQRDFSQGTLIRFQTKFPQELEGYISNQLLINFIEQINQMYAEAENMDSRICCESCFACLTAYLTYLCIESYFDKCLKRISAFIEEQNDTVFKPRGLYIVDPIDRGLRVIEIIINEGRGHS